MHLTKTLFLIILIYTSFNSYAQQYNGLKHSNYGGVHSIIDNPANAADSRHRISVNLGGIGLDLQNNRLQWDAPYSLIQFMTGTVPSTYRGTSGKPLWSKDYYKQNNQEKVDIFSAAEIHGPALAISLPKRDMGIAAGVNVRFQGNFINTSPVIIAVLTGGTKNPNLHNERFDDSYGSVNAGSYTDFYLSAAKVIDDSKRFLKVGATVKRSTSSVNLGVKANELDFEITPFTNEFQNVMVYQSKGEFVNAYSNVPISTQWLVDQFISPKSTGNGFGLDLGLVFEKRENNSYKMFKLKNTKIVDPINNKYLYKVSASITDIGYIQYKNPVFVQSANILDSNNFIPPATFYKLSGTEKFVNGLEKTYSSLNPATYGRSFTVLSPATLRLSLDYKLRPNIYVTSYLHQPLLPASRYGLSSHGGLGIIPRYERRNFEIDIPISLEGNYQSFGMGLNLRAGPFYLGVSNIPGILGVGTPRGLNIYTGLMYNLSYKRKNEDALACPVKEPFRIKLPFNKKK